MPITKSQSLWIFPRKRTTMRPSRSRSIAASLVQLALGLTPSTAFTLPPKINAAAAGAGAPAGAGAAGPRNSAGRLGMSARPTPGMDVDESSEYQYDEAEFADYAPDYSGVDDGPLPGDPELDLLDIDDLYADYSDIGGYDLSPFERHAREVFLTYAESSADDEEGDETAAGDSGIKREDLYGMLQTLDVEASEEESRALFKYLDVDDSGIVTLEEFLPWYAEAVDAAQQVSQSFQNLVQSRRTVHRFDATEVDDGVLRRALQCAIAAPNRRGTEPWRFIKLGKETVARITALREELRGRRESNDIDDTSNKDLVGVGGSFVSWTDVPHWIAVTYTRAPPDSGPEGRMQQREDFKSTCCAVQNLMLSMWSEGIGTKWTDGPIQRTEEFAEICNIDLETEKVAGVIWYGFAKGGLKRVKAQFRRKGVEEVLDVLP